MLRKQGRAACLADGELYSMEELAPDKPFSVKMLFAGLPPPGSRAGPDS